MNDKDDLNTVPKDFSIWAKKSISLLGTLGKTMDNETTIDFLVSHGIPEKEAAQIVIFLPIAFCKKLLPKVKWPLEYIELDIHNNPVKKFYHNNPRYVILENETESYCINNAKKEIIINIAGRSAEFKVINDLLLAGEQITDINLTPCIVINNAE